jgi:hypothetical protein
MNNEYGKITQLWHLPMEYKYVDFDYRWGIGFELGHPGASEFDPSHP